MQRVIFLLILLSVVANALKLASAPKKSEFSRSVFLKKVEKASKDNFKSEIMTSATEDFILKTAQSRIYNTFRTAIRKKGKRLGIDVPASWARHPIPIPEPEPEPEGDAEEEGGEAADAPAEEEAAAA